MPIGRLSTRLQPGSRLHHSLCNDGTWWIANVLHVAVGGETDEIRARAALVQAAEVYDAIGHVDDAARCRRIARSMPDSWTEEEA